MSHEVRFFSPLDIQSAVDMGAAVELMRGAFADLSSGGVVAPIRTHLAITGGDALVMPAYRSEDDTMVVKIATVHREPSTSRSSSVNAAVVLLDAETCLPTAIMDGTFLTALRTGAASGVATDVLARRDARVAGVVGSGAQSYYQIAGMAAVRPIRNVLIVAKEPDSAKRLAEKLESDLGMEVHISDSLQGLRDVDVLCTATNAREPFLGPAHVRPGAHINAIGSHRPEMSEIQPELVRQARLIVDQRAACLKEAGDILKPLRAGVFDEGHIFAELGEIITGARPGRSSKDQVTIFKSVGVAAQDLAVANHVLSRAAELNLGTVISTDEI